MTDWPPWLLAFMDTAVPALFFIVGVLLLHLAVRARTRHEEEGQEGSGLLQALLWGGVLPGAILLWFLYG
jgi:hypothetical protein